MFNGESRSERSHCICGTNLLHLYHVGATFHDVEQFLPGTHLDSGVQAK